MNSKVYMGPLDSKAKPLPVRLFLPVLPNLQPTLSLPISGGLPFYILFWVSQG